LCKNFPVKLNVMTILLNTSFADVLFEEELNIIKIIWKAKCSSEEYRHTFEIVHNAIKKHKIENFLSDIRKQAVISPEDRKWFQEQCIPKAMKAGLKCGAVVFDGGIFKLYYLNHISNVSKKLNLPFKFFTSIEEAENWLKNQKK